MKGLETLIMRNLHLVTDEKTDQITDPYDGITPQISAGASWWNSSFLYRQAINITNPESVDLFNYGVSFQFNYDTSILITPYIIIK